MAMRKYLPVLKAGERYEGWMPFGDDAPIVMTQAASVWPACAEVYATRKDARATAEDVHHVTIIVTQGRAR